MIPFPTREMSPPPRGGLCLSSPALNSTINTDYSMLQYNVRVFIVVI